MNKPIMEDRYCIIYIYIHELSPKDMKQLQITLVKSQETRLKLKASKLSHHTYKYIHVHAVS
jgi:hypothetical protein